MRGSYLKRLADAGDCARLDLQVGRTMLFSEEGRIVSWYSGPYAACGISVAGMEDLSCSVDADEFQKLSTLFDDEDELGVRPTESALIVSSKRGRKITLRYQGEIDRESYQRLLNDFQSAFEVDAAAFTREIRAVSQAVAVTMSQPILTGIRLVASDTVLTAEAANGASLISRAAIDISQLAAGVRLEVVAPANNLLDALTTLRTEGKLFVHMTPRALILRSQDTIFKLPVISGTWPQISAALKTQTFNEEMTLSLDTVRAVVQAVKVYKAPADVVFRPGDEPETIVIETKPVEGGQFRETIEGSISRPYTFDVADLDVISRTSGDLLPMDLGSTFARITTGKRRTYMLQRMALTQ